ncbi:fructosamine kinase family protein [Lacticaseibacillus rhamnosus]|nr:fructosamine kinase family protein [Lacticaseibacillus rhamnosus]
MLTAAWTKQLPLQHITAITPVGGGDVNQAYRVDTAEKPYFLLVQPGYPASFYAGEIAGLEAFEQADILAPRVIANDTIEGDGYLLLSFLTSGSGSQRDLGHLVAHLHQHHEPSGRFGFDYPYAGTSVSFANDWTDSWADLFIHQRLDKLSAHLRQKACGKQPIRQLFNRFEPSFKKRLISIIVRRPYCTATYGVATICSQQTVSRR